MDRGRWDEWNDMILEVMQGHSQGHNETQRSHILNIGMDRGRWDKSNDYIIFKVNVEVTGPSPPSFRGFGARTGYAYFIDFFE